MERSTIPYPHLTQFPTDWSPYRNYIPLARLVMGKTNLNATNPASSARSKLSDINIPHFSHFTTPTTISTSPLSPDNDVFYDALEDWEELFYDALDYFYKEAEPQSPDSISVSQSLIEGAEKGRQTVFAYGAPSFPSNPAPFSPSNSTVISSPTIPTNSPKCPRGACKPTASPPIDGQFPTSLTAQRAVSAPVFRTSKKKALLIGLDYRQCGKDALRLRHATQDARRFATTLTKLGYSSEDMKVVVDDEELFPSSEYIIEAMDWLVQDVLPGDHLFFMFSGHCEPPSPERLETCLVAADLMTIPRSIFHERLIGKIPAGAELTIVLDCCNAAGMVNLKYCVGKMEYKSEIKQTDKPKAESESGRPLIGPFPQQKSLCGVKNVDYQVPSLVPNKTPTTSNPAFFGTPVNMLSHVKRGVVAARPLLSTAVPIQVLAGGRVNGSPPSFTGIQSRPVQRRQLVVEGRPLPYFEERQVGFVAPAGKIVVWAGSGERQKAFEASNQVHNGIVTDAFCNVLEKSLGANSATKLRDLWHSIVGAIDRENSLRSERDANKAVKPPSNLRVQCAQLLVSQQDTLYSSSPILEQTVC
ncbi:unnamed protein product [Rhizoctonia solani]|uniref:Peptidase C14 caspase domain-containing protein n=1 Tax=Rhizoctonia solani TaxID=456999 RepID=A0A8H3CVF4_9AGAM|nr:unnamed protein product [Rhizoctonia solani]CAE6502094.1 unnamed protein product [Rhizoctonia solani]